MAVTDADKKKAAELMPGAVIFGVPDEAELEKLRTKIAEALAAERTRCAEATRATTLPPGYQWGRDAMEQFEFGKTRAALAIEQLNDQQRGKP